MDDFEPPPHITDPEEEYVVRCYDAGGMKSSRETFKNDRGEFWEAPIKPQDSCKSATGMGMGVGMVGCHSNSAHHVSRNKHGHHHRHHHPYKFSQYYRYFPEYTRHPHGTHPHAHPHAPRGAPDARQQSMQAASVPTSRVMWYKNVAAPSQGTIDRDDGDGTLAYGVFFVLFAAVVVSFVLYHRK